MESTVDSFKAEEINHQWYPNTTIPIPKTYFHTKDNIKGILT